MALREQMETEGQWLFRRRSYLPVVLVAIVLAAVVTDPPGRPLGGRAYEAACFLVGVVGLGVRVLVAGFVPRRTSGRNTSKGLVADELNTRGIYSVVRHPLYFGNFLVTMGAVAALGSAWLTAVGVLIFWLFYERIALAEEGFLRERFGEPFERWSVEVPAFVPRLRGWQKADLEFCWRTALKREYTTLAAFTSTFALFVHVRLAQAVWPRLARLRPDPLWAVVFAVGLVFYVCIRFVRKARLLSVEGR